ncbi:MAG: TRAP transporter small permease subunit [Enterobacterales bacterium]|nr:TRAP transporter small permease subunit [Enterobacterales bacterium]
MWRLLPRTASMPNNGGILEYLTGQQETKMPNFIKRYVKTVDAINQKVGRFAMYLVVMMIAILILSVFSRLLFDRPFLWTMELAQFTMAAYYLLSGGYSMQKGSHVRMDIFYERWSVKKRAFVDSITVFFLIFYLSILLYGGYSSTSYALEYGQKNYSAWAPYMAPIKIIMSIGILLMLLQAFAMLFKDIATASGKSLNLESSDAS